MRSLTASFSLSMLISACALEAAEQHTTAWVGGNSFASYSDPNKWDLREVPANNPGTNYLVLINASDSVLFDRLGGVTISSLNLASGTQLRLSTNTSLEIGSAAYIGGLIDAQNTNVSFRATAFGTTFGPQARVLVGTNSTVAIKGTTGSRYDWVSHYGPGPILTATGPNSLLDLSDLSVISMNNYYFDTPKLVQAVNGATVLLDSLTTVTGARSDSHRLKFTTSNGGTMALPNLHTVDGNTWFRMEVSDYTLPSLQTAQNAYFDLITNSTFHLPNLGSISGGSSSISVRNGSVLELPSLQSFSDGTVDLAAGGTVNAPVLQTFSNARLDLAQGENWNAPPPQHIDNARFAVTEGRTFAVAATSYDWTYNYGDSDLFRADGTNSLLDLKSLQRLSLGGYYNNATKVVLADNAGKIDLSGVQRITGTRTDGEPVQFRVARKGTIDLSSLHDLSYYTRFTAEWGTYTLPALVAATNAWFEATSGSTLSLPALTVMNGGGSRFTVPFVATILAPQLTSVADTTVDIAVGGVLHLDSCSTFYNSTVSLSPGKDFTTGSITNLDYASIYMTGDCPLNISATAYHWASHYGRDTIFSAEGDGCVFNLSSMRQLNFHNMYYSNPKLIIAKINAVMDLSGLEEVVGARNDSQPVHLRAENGATMKLGNTRFGPTSLLSATGDSTKISARSLSFQPGTSLSLALNATLELSEGLSYTNTTEGEISLDAGRLRFLGGGAKYLEVGGTDSGPNVAGTANFGVASISLGGDGQRATLRLQDNVSNGNRVAGAPEALYLLADPFGRSLEIAAGSVLVLNGVNAYALVNGQRTHLNGLIPANANSIAFDGGFLARTGGPRILAMTPSTAVTPTVSSVDVTFDQAIQPASFTLADVTINGPSGSIAPTGLSNLSGNTWRIQFPTQSANGTYTVQVGPQINEQAGNLAGMDQNNDGWPSQTPADAFQGTFSIDGAPPVALSALAVNKGTRVGLSFNEWIDPTDATNVSNYTINGSQPLSVTLQTNGTSVALDVPELAGDSFTLTMSHVADALGNATSVALTGTLLPMESRDVGTTGSNPKIKGSTLTFTGNDFEIKAGGSDFYWNASDAGHFACETRDGDFDIRTQILNLTTAETYTQVGLMWRESASADSRRIYICINHPNNYSKAWALIRWTPGAAGVEWPTYTAPSSGTLPNIWLRLKREGDVFTAFRSSDGINWQSYATVTAAFAKVGLIGPAVTARNNNSSVTAWLNNYNDIIPAIVTQPASQSVASGANVTFGVTARGLPDLAYQWQLNGVPLPGETNSLLQLLSVNQSRVGSYRVVVSNPFGSTTSREATLAVDGIGMTGFEGDLSPAPLGNNAVTVSDWVKVGRLVAGLDSPLNANEFTRADCAPRTNTALGTLPLGDGRLSVADWTQAGRYAAGVDPLTPAGGPAGLLALIAPGPLTNPQRDTRTKDDPSVRTVRAVGGKVVVGQIFHVPVELSALGGENALGFSAQFDPTRLSFVEAALADGLSGVSLQANAQASAGGSVGIVLAKGTGDSFPALTSPVVQLTFKAVGASGPTTVSFGDAPVWREIADLNAEVQAATYLNGAIRVVQPGRLEPIVRYSPDQVELRLTGEPGEQYRVEASADLEHWTSLQILTAGSDPVLLQTTASRGAAQQFYRAILVP